MIRSLLLVATLAAGCGGQTPQTRYYELAAPRPGPPAPASGPSLAVGALEVDAAYDDDRIVYRTSDVSLEYYYYHRWITDPGRMVGDYLRRAYRASGRFERVSAEITAETDLVLEGRIAAIEEVDRAPDRWIARIELVLGARDVESGALVWSRELTLEEPMREQSPAGLARALSRALEGAVARTAVEIAAQSTPGSKSSSSQGSNRSSRPTGQMLR